MDSKSRKMLSRSNSAASRRNLEDPQQTAIRFDYSETYFDNEELEDELEDTKYFIHRAKQKASIDNEVSLLAAKKNADEMLSLKEAIQKRDPNESSMKVLKSAEHCKRNGKMDTAKNPGGPSQTSVVESKQPDSRKSSTDTVDAPSSPVVHENKQQRRLSTDQKPLINTLTMYLLSLQVDRRNRPTHKSEERKDKHKKEDILPIQTVTKQKTQPEMRTQKRPKSFHGTGIRPATVHVTRRRFPSGSEDGDNKFIPDKPTYGIHVKKDFTRSRRKLEEISKLEQETKYGYVDKYEQRRRRLLAACKDTKLLDLRIQRFLKNVEEFNQISNPENSLERILLRSKSATYRRDRPLMYDLV